MTRFRIFALCCAVCIGLGALCVGIWFYPPAAAFAVVTTLPRIMPGCALDALTITSIRYDAPAGITLGKVNGIFKDAANVRTAFSCEQLRCAIPSVKSVRQLPLSIAVNGVALRSVAFQCRDAAGMLSWDNFWRAPEKAHGIFWVPSVTFDRYEIKTIVGRLQLNKARSECSDLSAVVYNGTLKGSCHWDMAEPYSYEADMVFNSVDLAGLKDINPELVANLSARLNGRLWISGSSAGIKDIQFITNAADGGKIRAAVLAILVYYMPQGSQKQELQRLLTSNETVPFETGILEFMAVADEKYRASVVLKSKRFNLDLNVKVDVSVEGGLVALLDQLQTIWQRKET